MKLNRLVKKFFLKLGFHIQRFPGGKPNPRHTWEEDEYFNTLVRKIENHTLVDKVRCFIIFQFITHTKSINGDVAEVGVYRGGTARLIAEILEEGKKHLHLFDTFEGMPEVDERQDIHQQGDFSDTSIKQVKRFLDGFSKVHFYQGVFPQTASPVINNKFSFVHIDVDIYQSVLDSCGFFYPRMVSGGIIVFDDYGFVSCPGAKRAVDDFFASRAEQPCYLPTGQCFVIKIKDADDYNG